MLLVGTGLDPHPCAICVCYEHLASCATAQPHVPGFIHGEEEIQ